MMLVNVTPHEIVVSCADGHAIVVLPPSGIVARCAETRTPVLSLGMDGDPTPVAEWVACDGHRVPLYHVLRGAVEGLPDPVPGTWYVASAMAAQAATDEGRRDVLCPGELVRDAEGRPIGCRGLTWPTAREVAP